MTADQIWQAALSELQLQMTKATFDTWVKNTHMVECDDGTFVIGVQDAFAKDWLENRLLTTVKRTLVGIVGRPVEVRFETVSPSTGSGRSPSTRPSTSSGCGADAPVRKGTSSGEQEIEVRPVYLSARSAIVQPDRLAAATAYFRDRWLPLLGALRWSLVVVLRGLATDAPLNPDGTRQVKTDRAELAQRLGVTPRTISRLLKSRPLEGQRPWRVIAPENEQAEYLSLFILRLRYRAVREGHVTRRTGLHLDVLMEDPLTPLDQQKASLSAALPEGASVMSAKEQLVLLHSEDAKGQNFPLHDEGAKGQVVPLPGAKRQNIPLHPEGAKGQNVSSQSAKGQAVRGNVNVNELTRYIREINLELTSKRRIRTELKAVVTMAEDLLSDYHSTAMLYKVLLALYPGHLALFTEAVEEAVTVGQDDPEANLGAVFVATLKELAGEAGVELGLGGT